MSENEFWETTPRYLQARIKAKQRDDQNAWVLGRQIAYWSILPHMGKKRIKPQDLAKFDWERVKSALRWTDDNKAHLEKFKALAMPLIEKIEAQNGS